MSNRFFRACVLLLLALAGGVAAADGLDGPPQRNAREARDAREFREPPVMAHESQPAQHSLAEAVRRVERALGGQILSAERVPFEGHDFNRIKVVDSTGRVRVITDDPRRPAPTRDDDGGND